jgi:hypothetical protein
LNGEAVFVVTRAQLVAADQNDAFDLYDAQVDGVTPTSPPACTGTGCQGVPAAPPTFATPPSVTFRGVGNLLPLGPIAESAKPKSTAKSLTRAQKLSKALKTCKKKNNKRKRMTCETRVRKKYGRVFKAKADEPANKKGR